MIKKLLFLLVFAALAFSANSHAQPSATESWLDKDPFSNWNRPGMRLPRPDRMARPNVARCRQAARPASMPVDTQLRNAGMWPVGPAQIYGTTMVAAAAKDFDGQCRPMDMQVFVFQGSRLIGTLSPDLMDSRTDGVVSNVRIMSEKMLLVEYARYAPSDALCCPSKTQTVYFDVTGSGASSIITPRNETGGDGSGVSSSLAGTKWRWEYTQTPVNKITAQRPNDYTVEFNADGTVAVKADCNQGRGRYTLDGSSLTFSAIALTRKACLNNTQDSQFTRGLAGARVFKRDGETMFIDMMADSGTMHFTQAK